jgi:hypothetical protein
MANENAFGFAGGWNFHVQERSELKRKAEFGCARHRRFFAISGAAQIKPIPHGRHTIRGGAMQKKAAPLIAPNFNLPPGDEPAAARANAAVIQGRPFPARVAGAQNVETIF